MKPLIFSLFTFITIQTFACDCGYGGSFLSSMSSTKFVALVKVKRYLSFDSIYNEKTPMSMEVEIIHKYKGKERRKITTVWGDNGILCRPYLSNFKEGEYYLMALHEGNYGGGQKEEKDTDYSIWNCGCYYLGYNQNTKTVFGDINSTNRTTQSMSLSKIKSLLKKSS